MINNSKNTDMNTNFRPLPSNVSCMNDIVGMRPDDSWDFVFDTPIELEFKSFWQEEPTKFECVSIRGWYWDEDDHRTDDFYFHDANSSNWVCKEYSLTKESRQKVMEIVYNKLIETGEIEVNENGKIVKNCFFKIWY
jgi:hypothetical protein